MDITGWKFTKNDEWETPIEYWQLLTPYIPKYKTIYDPFYMNGKAKSKWEKLGYDCYHENEDFFFTDPPTDPETVIVSNPPYSRRNAVLRRLMLWNVPFVLLMPITTLCYIKTQPILKGKNIQVIIPNIYKGFINLKGEQTKCPPFYLAFICYKMNLDKDILYL
jgi:hypothetical protein